MPEPLLSLEGVGSKIGSFTVLTDIGFTVQPEMTTVVLGRNGAGKTSTLRTIVGLIKATTGNIRFRGESITGLPTHELIRRGIAYVPEDRGIFGPLTVAENLTLAHANRKEWDRILDLFPILSERMEQKAGQLSGGQQQMLTVARALLQSPALLILDEPSKGLAPLVVEELFAALHKLRADTTILLVEQNLAAARKIGDNFVIIDDGVTVASGEVSELDRDDNVVEKFLTITSGQEPAAGV